MTHVHIYAPPAISVRVLVVDCPTCNRPRRMLSKSYEWHGAALTCAGCGDSWQDGWRTERPFMPGWRRQSIEYARRELAKIGVQA